MRRPTPLPYFTSESEEKVSCLPTMYEIEKLRGEYPELSWLGLVTETSLGSHHAC